MDQITDIIMLCCELTGNEEIEKTVKGTKKGVAIVSGCATVGGLVGGPIGLAVGM